jgi:hypothetical protein
VVPKSDPNQSGILGTTILPALQTNSIASTTYSGTTENNTTPTISAILQTNATELEVLSSNKQLLHLLLFCHHSRKLIQNQQLSVPEGIKT